MTELSDVEREEEREIYDTLEEERYLLKYLFTNIIVSRKYFSKVKEELFTSHTRLWLFRLGYNIFRESGTLLKESVLEAELDRIKDISVEILSGKKKTLKKLDHTKIRAEWHMITGADSIPHTPEYLMQDLERKFRAKSSMDAIEKTVHKILKGESDEAIQELNSDLIKIKSGVFTRKPVRRLSDPEWQLEVIRNKLENPEFYSCLQTGLKTFDSYAGLYKGELTLITAHTGVGKSTLMRSMAMGCAEVGLNVLFVVNEEVEEQAGNKFGSMFTGVSYRVLKKANKDELTEKDIDNYTEGLKNFGETCGEIFIQEFPQFHSCAEIEEVLVELEQMGNRIDVVMLDYLDHLKPMERAWSEIDEQNKAVAEFKNICMQFRVAGVTATQADTASVEMDDMSAYNVRGSKQKSGAANIVMAIKELESVVGEEGLGDDKGGFNTTWRVKITKNRDGNKFVFYCRFHKGTGTIRERDDERMSEKDKEYMEKEIEHFKSATKSKYGKKKSGPTEKDVSKLKEEIGTKEPEKTEEKPASIAEETKEMEDISEEDLSKKKIVRKAIE